MILVFFIVYLKYGIAIHFVQVANLGGEGMTTASTNYGAGTLIPLTTTTTRGKGTGGGGRSTDRKAIGKTFLETQFQGNVGSYREVRPFREGGRGYETEACWSVVGVDDEFVAAVEQRVICGRVGQVLAVVI